MMTKKKKLTEKRIKISDSKPTKHKLKRQLGHFSKATKQRLEAKKAGRR